MQLEKACLDPILVSRERLHFLHDVKIEELDPRHFMMFKQLVCLTKLWSDSIEAAKDETPLNFNKIYEKFTQRESLSQEKREEFINEDPSTKSNQAAVTHAIKILKAPKLKKVFMEIS